MQIKMKPGKPDEPGTYICKRVNSSFYELAYVFLSRDVLVIGTLRGVVQLDRLEDDTIFSERIDISVER